MERAEKQIILAKHGRRLLALLDDTPVVPGDDRPPYAHAQQARQILNDCEEDLREWQPDQDAFQDAAEAQGEDLEAAEAHEGVAVADAPKAAEVGA